MMSKRFCRKQYYRNIANTFAESTIIDNFQYNKPEKGRKSKPPAVLHFCWKVQIPLLRNEESGFVLYFFKACQDKIPGSSAED